MAFLTRATRFSVPILVLVFCIVGLVRQTSKSFEVPSINSGPALLSVIRKDSAPLSAGLLRAEKRDRFCVVYDVQYPSEQKSPMPSSSISLAVHSTSNYAHHIFSRASNWLGPVSFALFVDHRSAAVVKRLLQMARSYPLEWSRVRLHLVYQLGAFTEECEPLKMDNDAIEEEEKMNLSSFRRWSSSLPVPDMDYPINLMRNTARRGAPSSFQLVADMEMHFSHGAHRRLEEAVAALNDTKAAVVIRRFEIDQNVRYPTDVEQLRKAFSVERVVEFHRFDFPKGHVVPGIEKWMEESTASTETKLQRIPYSGSFWEPQVVLHSSAPMNEETKWPTRFLDQQTLIYELCRARFSFHVVSHVFNLHRGIKRRKGALERVITERTYPLRKEAATRYLQRIDSSYPPNDNCGQFRLTNR